MRGPACVVASETPTPIALCPCKKPPEAKRLQGSQTIQGPEMQISGPFALVGILGERKKMRRSTIAVFALLLAAPVLTRAQAPSDSAQGNPSLAGLWDAAV